MRFKSYIGKQVMCGQKIINFISKQYETDDEAEIKALSGAMDVDAVKGSVKEESKDESASQDV